MIRAAEIDWVPIAILVQADAEMLIAAPETSRQLLRAHAFVIPSRLVIAAISRHCHARARM